MPISKKRLKILLYGNLYGAYRSENLIKYLLDSGYRLSFIFPEFYFERGIKKDLISKILRIVFSAYYWVELFIKAALADVIYLLPMNVELIRSALWAARLFNAKLVVEVYASLYDTAVKDKQTVPVNSPEAARLKQKDTLALTQADYIIDIADYELRYWQDMLGIQINFDKCFIAPLFSEITESSASSSTALGSGGFKSADAISICWWGTFIPLHGLDNIIQAMQLLKDWGMAYRCYLFGVPPTGQQQVFEDYRQKIERSHLSDRVFLRQDLRFLDGSLPHFLHEHCDLALGIFGDTDKARAAVPNKLVEALTLGLPTLTMDSPALREFFDPEDLWTCEPTGESIANAIATLVKGNAYPVDWFQTQKKVRETFNVQRYQTVIAQVMARIEKDFQSQ
ncbi:glycosyltransferase [Romeria aff. gracilis LEGE 07310]|uniref:Glycosyltransferase n=1 Tax=Vasconcelosia minhoensis LEGE 07310 TaxID=915328 RepID=A0A8J7DBV5_9CYAN|nr:glycosyltransferase [Romeria gracilis]MBE9076973.1 glycosyltransferase [Romeria aff. gracilis LEGE 07310]